MDPNTKFFTTTLETGVPITINIEHVAYAVKDANHVKVYFSTGKYRIVNMSISQFNERLGIVVD